MKYLGKHLIKYEQGLYIENYETMMGETTERNKWRGNPYSGKGSLNIVKMSSCDKCDIIPVKIPAG